MTCLPAPPHEKASRPGWLAVSRSEADIDLLREVEERSRPVVLAPGHILFREGEVPKYLYLLKKGEVIFTIVSFGQTIPCFSVGEGTLLGLSAVVTSSPFALSATASPDAEVLRIDAAYFLELIEGCVARYMSALRFLAEETLRAHQALAELLSS